jgi:hypothetical protein
MGRLMLAALAVLLLVPVLPLALISSAVDRPEVLIVGAVWSTPTAVYVEADRGKGVRVGGAAELAEARIVEVRLPGAGPLWQGLAQLRVAGVSAKWRGERGISARLLGAIASSGSSETAFVRERWETLELPVNRKVWIVRKGERISFDARESGDLPARPL